MAKKRILDFCVYGLFTLNKREYILIAVLMVIDIRSHDDRNQEEEAIMSLRGIKFDLNAMPMQFLLNFQD